MSKKSNALTKIFKVVGITILTLILLVGGYASYFAISFNRIQDNLPLSPSGGALEKTVDVNKNYSMFGWNIGFGAYSADYSFFMDGGKESRGRSKEAVLQNLEGINQTLKRAEQKLASNTTFDFICFQEVDFDSTRSYKIDQREVLLSSLSGYSNVFAQNYNSPYILYPFNSPHGANKAGLLTISKFDITSSIRKQLPIENSLYKFFDLDRCYSKSRIKVENGRDLVIINFHLSAYTSDGNVATEQLKLLLQDCKAEYELGNYVVCTGDFNKDLFDQTSAQVFGIKNDEFNWAKTIPAEIFEGTHMNKVVPKGEEQHHPVPTCRNANTAYQVGQPVYTVDGFLVSDNVEDIASYALDEQFAFSDHNPITLTFKLMA
ncbi:MAG: endonuclease/exonuclease/phosphatase family protein [Clostridia bacterium]|nr:endonuclease/exonuclease/phosphatase family protein [Clostridia bacterium]